MGFHKKYTLSVLLKAVLLAKCNDADAKLKNKEDCCSCFSRHCSICEQSL